MQAHQGGLQHQPQPFLQGWLPGVHGRGHNPPPGAGQVLIWGCAGCKPVELTGLPCSGERRSHPKRSNFWSPVGELGEARRSPGTGSYRLSPVSKGNTVCLRAINQACCCTRDSTDDTMRRWYGSQ